MPPQRTAGKNPGERDLMTREGVHKNGKKTRESWRNPIIFLVTSN